MAITSVSVDTGQEEVTALVQNKFDSVASVATNALINGWNAMWHSVPEVYFDNISVIPA